MKEFILESRYFNNVSYNPKLNTVTKTSKNANKLIDEINWYLKLPKEFQDFLPKIKNYSNRRENTFIEMDYISSPTVGELFLNEKLPIREWEENIFPGIDLILQRFSEIKGNITYNDLTSIYIKKTMSRLKAFINQNNTAFSIYKRGYLKLNGKWMQCPYRYLEENSGLFSYIINKVSPGIIHGDLCFSNIFYDSSKKEIRLIDPRGSFGKVGIYGDQNYDKAKINHSLSGYDHIISDKFWITLGGIEIDFRINQSNYHEKITEIWLENYGGDPSVSLIESLLFLSMIPLHEGNYKRQLTMYAHGVQLLNQAAMGWRSE